MFVACPNGLNPGIVDFPEIGTELSLPSHNGFKFSSIPCLSLFKRGEPQKFLAPRRTVMTQRQMLFCVYWETTLFVFCLGGEGGGGVAGKIMHNVPPRPVS